MNYDDVFTCSNEKKINFTSFRVILINANKVKLNTLLNIRPVVSSQWKPFRNQSNSCSEKKVEYFQEYVYL